MAHLGNPTWASRLADLTRAFTSGLQEQEAVERVVQTVQLEPTATVALFHVKQDSTLELYVVEGPDGPAVATIPQCERLTFAGWVARTGTAVVSAEIGLDNRTSCLREAGIATGSAIGLPVRIEGRTAGVLLLIRRVTGHPTAEDLAGLQAVVDLCCMAAEQHYQRVRAEEQVRHLVALQEVSRLLTSTIVPERLLPIIVDMAVSLFNLDLCCLVLDDRMGSLRVRAAHGLEESIAASLAAPADAVPDLELFRAFGYSSVQMLTMASRTERLGYLVVGFREEHLLTESERSSLIALISLAGTALENSRWMSEADGVQQEMAEALMAVVEAEGMTRPGSAQARAGHASVVATHLGMPERDTRDLYLAALLAGVPLAQLCMPAHPSRRLQRVWSLLQAGQECWDGSGPAGLRGEAIPLGARVLSVVRAYTELILPGVKGDPPSPVSALLQLKKSAGKDWDPRVLSALESTVWRTLSLLQTVDGASEATEVPEPPQPEVRSRTTASPTVAPSSGASLRALSALTHREQEILALVAQGLSNREMARRLFLSEATVKTHVSRILHKLDLPDRTKAAVYALQGSNAVFM